MHSKVPVTFLQKKKEEAIKMRVLEANIYDSSTVYTESLYQHDKNVTLIFTGIDLPETYEVHFSNQKERGISVACAGNSTGVMIPDELLSTGEYVYAWICDTGTDSGKGTIRSVVIPVIPRPISIPVRPNSSSGDDDNDGFDYQVDADSENLIFINGAQHIMNSNIEEET